MAHIDGPPRSLTGRHHQVTELSQRAEPLSMGCDGAGEFGLPATLAVGETVILLTSPLHPH